MANAAFAPRQPIKALAGAQSANQVKFTILSTEGAGDVTLTVPGSSNSPFTISMAPRGEDGAPGGGIDQACWYGEKIVDGLPTDYQNLTYSITQSSDNNSGSFRNQPQLADEHAVWYWTCDRSTGGVGDTNTSWNYMHEYLLTGALLVSGMCITDDYGYIDTMMVDDSAGTGHVVTNQGNAKTEYDHWVCWLAVFGMLEDTSQGSIAWGRNEDRVYVSNNDNILPNHGNHDTSGGAVNPLGTYDVDLDTTIDGQWHITDPTEPAPGLGYDGPAYVVWHEVFDFLQGTSAQSADTKSNHWYTDLGIIRLITTDNITRNRSTVRVALGDDQIEDCLTAADIASIPFKLIACNLSLREPTDIAVDSNGSGILSKYTIFDNVKSEFQRFITDDSSSPQSIMLNPNTNGLQGAAIFLHGDLHRTIASLLQAPAYAGNLPELLYSINCKMTGVKNNAIAPSTVIGDDISAGDDDFQYYEDGVGKNNDTKIEYLENFTTEEADRTGRTIIQINAYGTKHPNELDIQIIMSTNASGTNRHFIAKQFRFVHKYSGNGTIPADKLIARHKSVVTNRGF